MYTVLSVTILSEIKRNLSGFRYSLKEVAVACRMVILEPEVACWFLAYDAELMIVANQNIVIYIMYHGEINPLNHIAGNSITEK